VKRRRCETQTVWNANGVKRRRSETPTELYRASDAFGIALRKRSTNGADFVLNNMIHAACIAKHTKYHFGTTYHVGTTYHDANISHHNTSIKHKNTCAHYISFKDYSKNTFIQNLFMKRGNYTKISP